MSHKRFPWLALAALIVVGLLIAGGTAIHRSGWTQGYMMGRLAAGGEDGAAVPYAYGYPGRHFGFAPALCGVGPLLAVGLLLLALIAAGKFFRFRAWKKAGGPEGERWARHWAKHWHHSAAGPVAP